MLRDGVGVMRHKTKLVPVRSTSKPANVAIPAIAANVTYKYCYSIPISYPRPAECRTKSLAVRYKLPEKELCGRLEFMAKREGIIMRGRGLSDKFINFLTLNSANIIFRNGAPVKRYPRFKRLGARKSLPVREMAPRK